MDMTAPAEDRPCKGLAELLGQIGDRWTVQVIVALHLRSRRFNELRRQVAGISQQMLTRTLKTLERDGLVHRDVHPVTPPQVSYRLTAMGESLSEVVRPLAAWAVEHSAAIRVSRAASNGVSTPDAQRQRN